MSEKDKDELIKTQQQVIGILFEVVKRLQENNKLDEEYFEIISNKNSDKKRIEEIMKEREENAKIVGRLLEQFEN